VSAIIDDPGEHDSFAYAWSVSKDGVLCPDDTSSTSTFTFTPDGGEYDYYTVFADRYGRRRRIRSSRSDNPPCFLERNAGADGRGPADGEHRRVRRQRQSNSNAVLDGSQAYFKISLDHAVDHEVTVYYNTMDGTGDDAAHAPSDYQSSNGPQMLVFEPWDSPSQIITVATVGGVIGDANKDFSVVLSHVYRGVLGVTASAVAEIHDDELKVYLTDAENTKLDVTDNNLNKVDVKVGEYVTLTAEINGHPINVRWVFPGDNRVIDDYKPDSVWLR